MSKVKFWPRSLQRLHENYPSWPTKQVEIRESTIKPIMKKHLGIGLKQSIRIVIGPNNSWFHARRVIRESECIDISRSGQINTVWFCGVRDVALWNKAEFARGQLSGKHKRPNDVVFIFIAYNTAGSLDLLAWPDTVISQLSGPRLHNCR